MNGVSLVPDRVVVGAAVVLTAVLFLPEAGDPVNIVKLAALLVCAVAALVLGVARVARERVLQVPAGAPALAAAALAAALVVATVVAPHTPTALWGTYGRNSGLLAYGAALLLLAVVLRAFDAVTVRTVSAAFVLAGLFTASYGLLQFVGVDAIGWNNPFNPIISALGNPNFAAAYMAIAAPCAVSAALWTDWPLAWRLLSGLTAALCLLTAGLSDAVQGPLAAAAGGLTVLALAVALGRSGTTRRLALVAVTVAGAAGLALLVLGLAGVGPGRAFFAGISYRARTWYWEAALAMFDRSPVWGVGLDSYGIRWRQERPVEIVQALGGDHYSDAAHSVPLQMLGTGGLVLGLAYLGFVVVIGTVLVRGLLRTEGPQRLVLGGVGGAWTAYQVQSLVSIDQVPLLVAHFVLAGAVVVAAGAGRLRTVRLPGALPTEPPPPAPGRRRSVVLPRQRETTGADKAVVGTAALLGLVGAALLLSPTRAALAVYDGDAAVLQGDGDVALAAYESAIDLDGHTALYPAKLGELYNRVGQPAEALTAYAAAAERDPFDLSSLRTAGRLADSQGEFDTARAYFERAAMLDPDNPATVLDLTQFQLRRGQAAEALARLEAVVARVTPIALPAEEAGLWATLGDARLVTGDPAAAKQAYDRALVLQPGQEVATAGLQKLPGRGALVFLAFQHRQRRGRVGKRALITGVTGQDGLYLAELLLSKGYEVYGLVRGQNNPKLPLLQSSLPDVRIVTGDLLDLSSLMRAFGQARPDEVYNLGAISFVAYSWENAHLTSDVTGKGVLNMLEATRLYAGDDLSKVRFYQASSSEMFGKVQDVPQRESTLLWPRSPYGVAKVFGHYMTINYRESYGMHASSGILFNHESPRRGPEFVTRKVTTAVARISLGLQDQLALGNLEAQRDWGFAGDYVKAMWLMLQQDAADDYVVATGETHSIRELLEVAFGHVGISDWERYVVQDPQFFRPAEVDLLVGDPAKARAVLGWEPEVGFQELVTMMVDSDLQEQKLERA